MHYLLPALLSLKISHCTPVVRVSTQRQGPRPFSLSSLPTVLARPFGTGLALSPGVESAFQTRQREETSQRPLDRDEHTQAPEGK